MVLRSEELLREQMGQTRYCRPALQDVRFMASFLEALYYRPLSALENAMDVPLTKRDINRRDVVSQTLHVYFRESGSRRSRLHKKWVGRCITVS